ncbi:MAG: Cytochrome bo(3) ubiquinol oxidase subunit 3 [Chlamydiae bacterium]|nr:Cytochrome bo(3) ubiquinol oxidase subunit 3 [Chlamydiota bacterium]
MTNPGTVTHEPYPDAYHDDYSKTIFGFWIYLLTDFILFAALFATYIVLHNSTHGGPSAREIFHLPFTLAQTFILLSSSFTIGLAGACAHRNHKNWTIIWFSITFLLGIAFMGMELTEFTRLASEGNSWKGSAFLSAYFTLVGTHGLHMILGLLWILIFLFPVWRQGLTPINIKRLTCLRMFWQFLNIVWIFIFSIVYLIGGNSV